MNLARTCSIALTGLRGQVITVEAHLAAHIPRFTIVGLPDASLGESRDRVRAAIESCGLALPPRRITVNLQPAALPKAGTAFDLAIAVAVLSAELPAALRPAIRSVVHLGELGLDGAIMPVRGVLPAVHAAREAGITDVVVPGANAAEARLVEGVQIHPYDHLSHLTAAYGFDCTVTPVPSARPPARVAAAAAAPEPDLADVTGQEEAKFALEVAAAGGHHLLLIGPPGTGKTMLAARLPGIMADLPDDAALAVSSVHSLLGTFDGTALVRRPPFVAPHHTASHVALVGGGGGVPRPGAISQAHCGVLFLDEAPEFPAAHLQTLRQPLENGEITIHRARAFATYPARFQLVLAANPCPCGYAFGKGTRCTCTPFQRRRYLSALSGPLLDRIDIRAHVNPVRTTRLTGSAERSADVALRVAAARDRQAARWANEPWTRNADVPGSVLRGDTSPIPGSAREVLDVQLARGALSLRGVDRVLRVALTLADLAGRPRVDLADIGAALLLRTGDDDAAVA